MDKKNRGIEGAVSLEACIVVTLFIFFMLFMYSLLPMFLGHHAIGRAVLQASESLSLDPYSSEKFYNSTDSTESVGDLLAALSSSLFKQGTNPYYSSAEKWYEAPASSSGVSADGSDGSTGGSANAVEKAAKDRFVAYFANGDVERAEALLADSYNVDGGLNGMNFSESKVEGGILYVTVKYRMDYEFNFFKMAKQDITQSAKAKLWK